MLHQVAARQMADRLIQRRQRPLALNRQSQKARIRHLLMRVEARFERLDYFQKSLASLARIGTP